MLITMILECFSNLLRLAHVALGPFVGALGRVARGGRNWEGYADDRE